MGRLEGKVALITGAGRGIGRGVALAMAKEGAAVAIVELDPATATSTAEEIEKFGGRALAVPCDVRTRAACEAAVDTTVAKFGGLDIVVNNAAAKSPTAPITQVDDDALLHTFEVSAFATFWFMQAAHDHLVARGGGSIINFASAAGTSGQPHRLAYAAAKEAVRAMTRVAANEWGPEGITVNVICPLAASEGMLGWVQGQSGGLERLAEGIPMRRVGDCEADVGRVAVFLASDDARYVTAQTMWVDGGSGRVR